MKVTRLLLEPTQPWKYFSCALEVSETITFTRKTKKEERVSEESYHVAALVHCVVHLQP